MNPRLAVAVALPLLLAGCTSVPGQQAQQETPPVIQVDGPVCTVAGQPCSNGPFTRYAGSVNIRLTVTNTADHPIYVDVGDRGRKLMVSKCNSELLGIKSGGDGFSLHKVSPSIRTGVAARKDVAVKQDEQLIANWTLDILADDQTISRLGNACPLDFELRFTQPDVQTARQIQIKEDTSVPDISSVDTQTGVKRPVRLRVTAPRSVVAGETKQQVVAKAYFENVGRGRITDIKNLETVTAAQPGGSNVFIDRNCNLGADIRMFGEGPRSGQSYRRSCGFTLPKQSDLKQSSQVEWIRFEGTYTYEMPLGTKTIGLKPTAQEG